MACTKKWIPDNQNDLRGSFVLVLSFWELRISISTSQYFNIELICQYSSLSICQYVCKSVCVYVRMSICQVCLYSGMSRMSVCQVCPGCLYVKYVCMSSMSRYVKYGTVSMLVSQCVSESMCQYVSISVNQYVSPSSISEFSSFLSHLSTETHRLHGLLQLSTSSYSTHLFLSSMSVCHYISKPVCQSFLDLWNLLHSSPICLRKLIVYMGWSNCQLSTFSLHLFLSSMSVYQ